MRIFVSALIIVGMSACSEAEVRPKKIPLADLWEIEYVSGSGEEKPEWQGLDFTFEQTSDSSGNYYLPLTPYDTIWRASGTWTIEQFGNKIHFDNFIEAQFEVSQNTLAFQAYLPWTEVSTCYDGMCLPVVTGYWNFKLKRKKT